METVLVVPPGSGVAGLGWVEAEDAAQHRAVPRSAPPQRVTRSRMSVVLRWRGPRTERGYGARSSHSGPGSLSKCHLLGKVTLPELKPEAYSTRPDAECLRKGVHMLEGTVNSLGSLEVKVESLEAGLWYRDLCRAREGEWGPCARQRGRLRVHSRTVPVVTLGKGLEAKRPTGGCGLCGRLERPKSRTAAGLGRRACT